MAEQVCRPGEALVPQPGIGEVFRGGFCDDAVERGLVAGCSGSGKGERDGAEAQIEQAAAVRGLDVIVPLRRGPGNNFNLPGIEAEPPVRFLHLRLTRPLIRQEDPGRAGLDQGRGNAARGDVGQRLGGENDRDILFTEGFQPFAQTRGKLGMVEEKPGLVEDQQGGPAVEPVLKPVKEMGQDGERRAGEMHQRLHLETDRP